MSKLAVGEGPLRRVGIGIPEKDYSRIKFMCLERGQTLSQFVYETAMAEVRRGGAPRRAPRPKRAGK